MREKEQIGQDIHRIAKPFLRELDESFVSVYLGDGWELRRSDDYQGKQLGFTLSDARHTLSSLRLEVARFAIAGSQLETVLDRLETQVATIAEIQQAEQAELDLQGGDDEAPDVRAPRQHHASASLPHGDAEHRER